MKKLQNALKSYFNFTKGESHAVLLLLFIMTLLLLMPRFFESQKVMYNGDFTQLYQLADSLNREAVRFSEQRTNTSNRKPENRMFKGRNFNPNSVSSGELMAMGLPEKLSERIVSYRTKVAPFLCKSDLKKVYGIDDFIYNQISEFVQLPVECKSVSITHTSVEQKNSRQFSELDLNQADTNSLILLPGIGAKLAQRIVKYREKLGGFINVEQLKEVWGLKPEVLALNHKNWSVNSTLIQKIAINECSVEQLGNHPYCGYKMAKIIVAYRQQHGKYSAFENLANLVGMDLEKLQLLQPYLVF